MPLQFNLSYAGISFVEDTAKIVRLSPAKDDGIKSESSPIRQQQPLADLVDELNRLIPFKYLQDFGMTPTMPGRNLASIAYLTQLGPQPGPDVRIGDWYYPNTACRWGVFRGLATSSQMKAMLTQTNGGTASSVTVPRPFIMQANPISPDNNDSDLEQYTVEDLMYMLPPRPLAEQGGQFDGLFLITLVDERYYWQYNPVSLRVTSSTTWEQLIAQVAAALGITIGYDPISPLYLQPEPDSQFWCNMESAAVLLDALAYNIGRTVVRLSHNNFYLMTAIESSELVSFNRGKAENVVRTAGGDIFNSGIQKLPSGQLTISKNLVIPANVIVSFPKYVVGDDPVPHFLNSRYKNQRPSAWFEESYGDTYDIQIPIQQAGVELAGLVGVAPYAFTIHSTAKALLNTEADTIPINADRLILLAAQLANDFYNDQTAQALDEVYPGTYLWEPEGIHDIIWTFSSRARQATTRVMKCEWNQMIPERQHSTPAPVFSEANPITYPQTNTPRGVGGPSVALTMRDTFSGSAGIISTSPGNFGEVEPASIGPPKMTLTANVAANSLAFPVASVPYLPTQNRWRGQVGNEIILFEGTSGGVQIGHITFEEDECALVTQGYTVLFEGAPQLIYFPVATEAFGGGATISPAFPYPGGSPGFPFTFVAGGTEIQNGFTVTAEGVGAIIFQDNLALPGGVVVNYGDYVSDGLGVQVVNRGIDGTVAEPHSENAVIRQAVPDTNYGTNYIRHDKGQFTYPAEWTNGIQGAVVIPQTQTVQALDGYSTTESEGETVVNNGGTSINGTTYYSGRVDIYDPTQPISQEFPNATWVGQEYVWIKERNSEQVFSGQYYDGQFVNYSPVKDELKVAPIYAINAATQNESSSLTVIESDGDPECDNVDTLVVDSESMELACLGDGQAEITAKLLTVEDSNGSVSCEKILFLVADSESMEVNCLGENAANISAKLLTVEDSDGAVSCENILFLVVDTESMEVQCLGENAAEIFAKLLTVTSGETTCKDILTLIVDPETMRLECTEDNVATISVKNGNNTITVEESDGSPVCHNVSTLIFDSLSMSVFCGAGLAVISAKQLLVTDGENICPSVTVLLIDPISMTLKCEGLGTASISAKPFSLTVRDSDDEAVCTDVNSIVFDADDFTVQCNESEAVISINPIATNTYDFMDSCTIEWELVEVPEENKINVFANWLGLEIYGDNRCLPNHSESGNTCGSAAEFIAKVNRIIFDACSFSVNGDAGTSCDLGVLSVTTCGLTTSVEYLKSDCTTGIMEFVNGLLKVVS